MKQAGRQVGRFNKERFLYSILKNFMQKLFSPYLKSIGSPDAKAVSRISKPLRRLSAQHLVEFILFFPFFLAVLGILMDFSMALYSNYKFNLALHQSINMISMENKLQSDVTEIADRIKNTTRASMKNSKAIYADTVETGIVFMGDMTAVTASYNYITAFTLVNAFFPALPEKFFFKTAIIVNDAILRPNYYSITNSDLEYIFSTLSQEDEPEPTTPQTPESGEGGA